MKKVLFIGAGASYGARVDFPKHDRPPLGADLLAFLRDNLHRIRVTKLRMDLAKILHTRETAQAIRVKDFEAWARQLDERGREAVARAIFFLMSAARGAGIGFGEQADLYDRLISALGINSDDWVVVSLNYDALFEQALKRFGMEPAFAEVSGSTIRGVTIYKPHGSGNFVGYNPGRASFGQSYIDDDSSQVPVTRLMVNSANQPTAQLPVVDTVEGDEDMISYYEASPNFFPIIAFYTIGKPEIVNPETIQRIRAGALKSIKEAPAVVCIGVRPTTRGDDPFVYEALENATSPFLYVNSSPTDIARAKELVGQNFTPQEMTLKEFVEALEFLELMKTLGLK